MNWGSLITLVLLWLLVLLKCSHQASSNYNVTIKASPGMEALTKYTLSVKVKGSSGDSEEKTVRGPHQNYFNIRKDIGFPSCVSVRNRGSHDVMIDWVNITSESLESDVRISFPKKWIEIDGKKLEKCVKECPSGYERQKKLCKKRHQPIDFGRSTVMPTVTPKEKKPLTEAVESCISGGSVAVKIDKLYFSKYFVNVGVFLLVLGVTQILVAVFVFLLEALDIYMLLLNYCASILLCSLTVFTSNFVKFTGPVCRVLSSLNCMAISVPMFCLMVLSFSRFYAITYPFRYVDMFTMPKQCVACLLSWGVPLLTVVLGNIFLCESDCIWVEGNFDTGFCIYRAKDMNLRAYLDFKNETNRMAYLNHTKIPEPTMSILEKTIGCQLYIYLYISVCLILPLLGCIVCYALIVYRLTVIKAKRADIMHSTSSCTPSKPTTAPISKNKKSKSLKDLRSHFKSQTSRISQKAKEKVPVSIILILSLYILTAIPLTLTQIYNTSFISASESLVWLDPPSRFVEEKYNQSNKLCFDNDKVSKKSSIFASPPDTVTLLLDVAYSIGILALGLSPWAYIKFTKSFEENLWIKPWRQLEEKLNIRIRDSVREEHRKKQNNGIFVNNSATTSSTSFSQFDKTKLNPDLNNSGK